MDHEFITIKNRRWCLGCDLFQINNFIQNGKCPRKTPYAKSKDKMINSEQIVKSIHNAIETCSVIKYPAEHRNHLGASILGDKCSRKSWYTFRWCKLEQHIGRMRRLFQRGHREEEIFKEVLKNIGAKIISIDPTTGKQYHIGSCNGHFGGSADGVGTLPWLTENILFEFKTHNTKSFTYLVEKGLIIGKQQHYDQMCLYGKGLQLNYGLYCAINKNDDDYYFELVELDWNRATQLENKAADIITSQIPPQRISNNPAYFECKWCQFQDICHHGECVEINCRSCKNASPIEDAQWTCSKYGKIPSDFVVRGCKEHESINC